MLEVDDVYWLYVVKCLLYTGVADEAKQTLQQSKKKYTETMTSLTTTVCNLQFELKSVRTK